MAMTSSSKNPTGAFPTYYGKGSPVTNGQQGVPGETYLDTTTSPQTQWYMNAQSVWMAIGTPGAAGIATVVGGTDIEVDDTDPLNPVVSFDGTALTVLTLSYAGGDPSEVTCFGVPTGFDNGIAGIGAQLTVGVNIPSGALLDTNSNPIPDGFTFPASIFVEGTTIYDIMAFNPWTDQVNGGLVVWGDEGGAPGLLYIPGGISSLGPIIFGGLPTSDPANPGQLWNNLGILTVSAG